MEERKAKLIKDIADLDISPLNIESEFRQYGDSWDMESAWDKFTEGTSIHLGKHTPLPIWFWRVLFVVLPFSSIVYLVIWALIDV